MRFLGIFFFCTVNFINCVCHARKTPFQFVCFKNNPLLYIEKLFDKIKSRHSQDFCVVYTFSEVFFFFIQPFTTQWNTVHQEEVELGPWESQKRQLFQVVVADMLFHQTAFENQPFFTINRVCAVTRILFDPRTPSVHFIQSVASLTHLTPCVCVCACAHACGHALTHSRCKHIQVLCEKPPLLHLTGTCWTAATGGPFICVYQYLFRRCYLWKITDSVENDITAPPAYYVHIFVLRLTFYTVEVLFSQCRFTV